MYTFDIKLISLDHIKSPENNDYKLCLDFVLTQPNIEPMLWHMRSGRPRSPHGHPIACALEITVISPVQINSPENIASPFLNIKVQQFFGIIETSDLGRLR